ncbi:MAG: hypothetical protein A3K10_01915 [Bacteroidetes bacterium RIFCSPLOWO2_12_FULL_31_6]|nr:MAG: hypothetical protein A3K10_01915 [Bacteroidetes bacterium RIFCSPLOWO2_12_FULL_31_6]
MKIRLLIFFLLISSLSFSQKTYLDSLWKVWNDISQSDTNRLKAMYDFAWDGYLYTQPDSSYYFSKKMLDFAIEKGEKEYQAKAINLQFNYFFGRGDFVQAMEMNNESFRLREQIGDKLGMAVSFSNYGILYQIHGDYKRAIDHYLQSLKYNEIVGNKSGVASSLHNIGHLYHEQMDYSKAIDYYNQSLKISEEINDVHGIATSLINLGSLYNELGENKKAMESISKSLRINSEIGNKPGVAAALGNIGMIYQSEGEYSKAIDYYTQSLAIQEEIGSVQTMAISFLSIGSVYLAKKDNKKAILFFNKSLKISQKIGDVSGIKNASKNLYHVYKSTSNFKEALQMHELHIQMLDSINSESSKKELVRQEFKYEYEKKVSADSVRFNEQKKVVAAQFKQERTQRYALYTGLGLLFVFGGFMFNRFKIIQKQKNIIEGQKLIVETKQQEILDSIHYAKRIQQSLLPNDHYIDKNLKRLSKS